MNRSIAYYYNIIVDNKLPKKGIVNFVYNNEEYYFVVFERDKKDILKIIEISDNLKQIGFNCHRIIYNIFNSPLSLIDNSYYVLLKILTNKNKIIDFYDIIHNSKTLLLNYLPTGKHNNWGLLWQRKVDYLERQIRQLGKGKMGIINSFSYYVGLAENAIIYYNNTNKYGPITYNICLSHRRIYSPNVWLNYGNPLSFILDLDVRDIAEYLKYNFFYSNHLDVYADFDYLLKSKKMSNYSFQMLMSRLLFPTYYFDVMEKIILEDVNEELLVSILSKSSAYEKFLKYCFNKSKKYYHISGIPEWLL